MNVLSVPFQCRPSHGARAGSREPQSASQPAVFIEAVQPSWWFLCRVSDFLNAMQSMLTDAKLRGQSQFDCIARTHFVPVDSQKHNAKSALGEKCPRISLDFSHWYTILRKQRTDGPAWRILGSCPHRLGHPTVDFLEVNSGAEPTTVSRVFRQCSLHGVPVEAQSKWQSPCFNLRCSKYTALHLEGTVR